MNGASGPCGKGGPRMNYMILLFGDRVRQVAEAPPAI
jgi:hypothetical protein